tara:strand:+ start:2540 stop:3598 length:1059 start_codon:yes stop_codon:yes gene_type:complete
MAVTVKVSEFGAIVDTITYEYIVPKITDNILTGNVLAMRFLTNQKPATSWGSDVSGAFMGVPIKYQKSTSGGWYKGFDTFSTSQTNTRVLATYSPKQLYWSVGASGIQVGVNQTPQQILPLITVEMNSVADDMMDTFGTGLYSDGTGTSNKQLTGLQAAVDDGNTIATYAGLLRSTYTTWVSNLDSSSNAITRAEMAASFDAAKIGNDAPTLGITTPAIWSTIEGLAMGTIHFNNPLPGLGREYGNVARDGVTKGQGGELGYTALFFRGRPIVADEKCTAGYFYWLNERHIGLAKWGYPNFPGYQAKSNYNGFAFTGLKIPTNQDATVGQFLFYGELVTDACRTHSYMTGKS